MCVQPNWGSTLATKILGINPGQQNMGINPGQRGQQNMGINPDHRGSTLATKTWGSTLATKTWGSTLATKTTILLLKHSFHRWHFFDPGPMLFVVLSSPIILPYKMRIILNNLSMLTLRLVLSTRLRPVFDVSCLIIYTLG